MTKQTSDDSADFSEWDAQGFFNSLTEYERSKLLKIVEEYIERQNK